MSPNSDTLVFTLCSNNYLSYAKVLADSFKKFNPEKIFVVGLVDRKREDIPYAELGCPVVEISTVIRDMSAFAAKFSLVELNTFAKPTFFRYFFDHFPVDKIIFLDPDICLFDSLDLVCNRLNHSEFVLTPHVLTPIPLDGKTPEESLFLNYGVFNFGFVALRKTHQTLSFLHWWQERTYARGYDRPASGLFTDQIWGNLIPVYFSNVHILVHRGYNMAIWNLHERTLTKKKEGGYRVNSEESLVFYHFSGVLGNPERINRDYSRFNGIKRSDLETLYHDYLSALNDSVFFAFAATPCYYASYRVEQKPSVATPIQRRSLPLRMAGRLWRMTAFKKALPEMVVTPNKS